MAPNEIREIISQLKLERDILKDAQGRPRSAPSKDDRLFRDSILCLNFNVDFERHPCNQCLLWDWVPDKHRYEAIPCHFIPLNQQGQSIADLEAAGKREEAEQALLAWLQASIQKLEGQLERSTVESQ